MKNSLQVWKEVKERIKNSGAISEFQYTTWINFITEAEFKNNILYLWVPNSVVKTAIEEIDKTNINLTHIIICK